MPKLLSIIVPAFDMERYLPQCLESLVLPPDRMARLDVIVVNDGSSDGTGKIAHRFAVRFPESVRVVDKPNGHYGSCVNAALPLAAGEFVKVLDADDSFDSGGLAALVDFLADCPAEANFVLTDYVKVDAAERPIKTRRFGLGGGLVGPEDLALSDAPVLMYALTYRTRILRGRGYVQTEGVAYTDNEWTFLPLVWARRGAHCPHLVYRYLAERPGQSVAYDVMKRSGWMMRRVCDAMVGAYARHLAAGGAASAYLDRSLGSMAAAVCRVAALHDPLREAWGEIAGRLDALAFRPEAREAMLDEVRVLSSTRRPFRYVRFMSAHPRLRLPVLLLLRGYRVLYGVLDAIHRVH